MYRWQIKANTIIYWLNDIECPKFEEKIPRKNVVCSSTHVDISQQAKPKAYAVGRSKSIAGSENGYFKICGYRYLKIKDIKYKINKKECRVRFKVINERKKVNSNIWNTFELGDFIWEKQS